MADDTIAAAEAKLKVLRALKPHERFWDDLVSQAAGYYHAPSFWSLASLQQGSTLQLPSYYPIVGGEAGNMRYAIYSPKASPHPKYIHPLCASPQAP